MYPRYPRCYPVVDGLQVPATRREEAEEFVASLAECPKTGLHNPFKNPGRFVFTLF